MNNERSNSASRIRTRVGPRIFGFPPTPFSQADWRYTNCRTLIGRTETNGQICYNPFAPILYHDYEGHGDLRKIFLNQSLFDVSFLTYLINYLLISYRSSALLFVDLGLLTVSLV